MLWPTKEKWFVRFFVKEIRRNGQVIKTFEPVVLKNKICSDKTLRDLNACLKGVISNGTGSALKSAYFDIAGKTGTARILNSNNRYGNFGEQEHQASFAGFFPAEDPIYSCIVVISAPTEQIYGAAVSGTVFSAIANKVYASELTYHKAINEQGLRKKETPISIDGNRTDLKKVLDELKVPYDRKEQAEWVRTSAQDNKITFKERTWNKALVPDVYGMSAKDATYLLEACGMIVHLSGYGIVTSQSVEPGKKIESGQFIELKLEL